MDALLTLNFWLWAAAILLALAYLAAGGMKAVRPIPVLAEMLNGWPADMPRLTRFIGAVEVLGAIGLILPLATGILPWLTPLAAIGLSVIQVLAIGFHAQRGEVAKTLAANLILLALSLFVLWGRWPLFGI